MSDPLEWLGDDGPLVILSDAQAEGWLGIWREARPGDPEDEVEEWRGARMVMDADLDEESPSTDYGRACAALEPPALAAIVPYATGVALALETSGHQAAIVRLGDDVVVAKWIFAPGEDEAAARLTAIPPDLAFQDTGVVFEQAGAGARLHPAASRVEEDVTTLPVPLAPGRYAVAIALYEPDEDTSFELFRLRRA